MSENLVVQKRYRGALVAGAAVVIMLQAALFAFSRSDTSAREESRTSAARLVDLPETAAPLADVSTVPTPDPADDPAPRRADVVARAEIPTIPDLSLSAANTMQPVMFMENLQEPEAEENPAVSYATVSDFLVPSTPNPQPLRPIDDRPVSVLAAIGGSRGGIGIGGDGPHCAPGRPYSMLRRSPVVSGAPSLLRSPRM